MKSKNALSEQLNLTRYVDSAGLEEALRYAGCVLPPNFGEILDLHMRVLFHRYYFSAPEVQGPLLRERMSREMRHLLGGDVEASADRNYFIRYRNNMVIVWHATYHSPSRTKDAIDPVEVGHLSHCLDRDFGSVGLPMNTDAIRTTFIPKTLKSRRGGRNLVRLSFTPEDTVLSWPDENKHPVTGAMEMEVRVVDLADALLVMDPIARVRAITIIGVRRIPERPCLLLWSPNRCVIIFDNKP